MSRPARATCTPADRPETSAVAARTPALADLLPAMASASQQSASALASSQPRSGAGPRRDANTMPAASARSRAPATRCGLVGSPARQQQPPREPARGEDANRTDPEPDGRHPTCHPRGIEPCDEGQCAVCSLVRHRSPLPVGTCSAELRRPAAAHDSRGDGGTALEFRRRGASRRSSTFARYEGIGFTVLLAIH